jgi:hypothetical protein
MDPHSKYQGSAASHSGSAHRPGRPRQSSLRGFLHILAAILLKPLSRNLAKDAGPDFQLGEQVKLPEELLQAVTQDPNRIDRG